MKLLVFERDLPLPAAAKAKNPLSLDHKKLKLPIPLDPWHLPGPNGWQTSERIDMRTFVVKLAAWHRVSKDLEAARLRLAQAEAAQSVDAREGEIREAVDCLSRACDLALGELRAAADAYIAAGRQQSDSTPVEYQPPQFVGVDQRVVSPRERMTDSKSEAYVLTASA